MLLVPLHRLRRDDLVGEARGERADVLLVVGQPVGVHRPLEDPADAHGLSQTYAIGRRSAARHAALRRARRARRAAAPRRRGGATGAAAVRRTTAWPAPPAAAAASAAAATFRRRCRRSKRRISQPSSRATRASVLSGLTATGWPTARSIGRSDSESE